MSISGITVTDNNGVSRITNAQTISGTGIINGECVVLDGASSYLECTGSGVISIINSAIIIDSDTGTGNDASAVLNYGGRTVTGTTFEVEDSIIIVNALTARHNIQFTDIRNSLIVEQDGTGQVFIYTRGGGDIIGLTLRNINVWEVYGPPANLANVIVDGASFGYLNWEAGRLDFFNFNVLNITPGGASAHAWLGTGNGGNNSVYHWNNGPDFDNEGLYLTSVNSEYHEGFTACWKFIDQITGNPVEGAVVLLRDNFSGPLSLLATFLTNSNGLLSGTWDSQNRITGSNIERPVLFLHTLWTSNVDTGAPGAFDFPAYTITGDQGDRSYNYSLDSILNQIEIRSFYHLAPEGFKAGDSFIPTQEIGKRGADGSVESYQNILLIPDPGVTSTKILADALPAITNLNDLFDRTKSEWVDNNDYPLPTLSGVRLNTGANNLVVDGGSSNAWDYASGTDTITIGTLFNPEILFVSSSEAFTQSGESDQITINYPIGRTEDDFAILIVGHAQSEENSWNTPSGWAIAPGLTEVITGGTPASVPGVSVFYKTITGSEGSSVTVTNAGTNTSGLIAQMLVYRNVDTTTPFDTPATVASGASGDSNPSAITTVSDGCRIITIGFMDDGDQSVNSVPSGYTNREDTATIYGAGVGE